MTKVWQAYRDGGMRWTASSRVYIHVYMHICRKHGKPVGIAGIVMIAHQYWPGHSICVVAVEDGRTSHDALLQTAAEHASRDYWQSVAVWLPCDCRSVPAPRLSAA